MALFKDTEKTCAEALVALGYCNPFLPERIAFERVVLGNAFVGTDGPWHKHVEVDEVRPNIELLTQRAKVLADTARERLLSGQTPGEAERGLYEDTALYYLFNAYVHIFIRVLRRI